MLFGRTLQFISSTTIVCGALSTLNARLAAQTNVTTYHNDNGRTGQYLSETLLTPGNVQAGMFGKRFVYNVDGEIYGQPLYLSRVVIPDVGLRDVVYVATGHGSVYAFDADNISGVLTPLWQVSFVNEAAGVTAVPAADVNCGVIFPEIGVVGTPVIDPSTGTLYVIAETREPGPEYVFRLHALDVATGAERPNSPVVIQAPGFVPLQHKQRGALLLANGTIYSTWSSHCDNGSYHGWVFAHNAATLEQTGVFNATPQGNGASFWNAGGGPAADSNGNIFLVSANGDFTANAGGLDFGDSVIKMNGGLTSIGDYFTPFNQAYLDGLDLDVGSSEAVLLPDSAGSSAHPHLLATAGKEGRLYLLDRDNLGHAQVSNDAGALASNPLFTQPILGSVAWYAGSLYVAGQNEPMQMFNVSNGEVSATPAAQSAKITGIGGAVPSISANENQAGIAWMVTSDAALSAFDATDLTELYDSSAQLNDSLGTYAEFAVPTPANGKVYVGANQTLVVYGEIAQATPVIAAATNAASFAQAAVAPGSLITLFGSALSLTTQSATTVPLPISMNDVVVTFNGTPAPLLYISPTQINAQVPASIAVGNAQVQVQVAGQRSTTFAMQVQPSAPGIFTSNGVAAAVNQDGTVNTPTNPAASGSYVSVYLTGNGALDSDDIDGDPSATRSFLAAAPDVSATLAGQPANVTYAGPAPGYIGLIQINLQVPQLPAGASSLKVTIDSVGSNAALLYVGQ